LKRTFFISGLAIFTVNLNAQKTWFGIEAAITSDQYSFTDPGNNLRTTPIISSLVGLNVRYEANPFLSFETGILRKHFNKGYNFNATNWNLGYTNDFSAFQLPLRIKTSNSIYKDKVYFTTTLGYHFCFSGDNKGNHGKRKGSIRNSTGDTIYYYDTLSYGITKTFSLVEAGGGIDIKFKKCILSFGVSYFTGFRQITRSQILYSINSGPPNVVYAYSKGDYWYFGMKLRCPLARANHKKGMPVR
jgi:hypothetical protein